MTSSFPRRLARLERRTPTDDRPRIIPFPIEGMTDEEIEAELARRKERGPTTAEEWTARFCEG